MRFFRLKVSVNLSFFMRKKNYSEDQKIISRPGFFLDLKAFLIIEILSIIRFEFNPLWINTRHDGTKYLKVEKVSNSTLTQHNT